MSTAGRINKSGPRFVPKRKNPPATASRASREGSAASSTAGPTPKPALIGLPPLGEDPIEEEREPDQPTLDGTTATTAGSNAASTSTGTTSIHAGTSSFAPSDPTAASSSQASAFASTSLGFAPSDPSSSAPFSTGNSGHTHTQATSFGEPTQPPAGSKSPQNRGGLFLLDQATSPPATSRTPASSSPTRGTVFAVSNVPPTQLSPSRRAVELQPDSQATALPLAATGSPSRKRKAQRFTDSADEEGSGAETTSPRVATKGKGKEKASQDEPPAKRAASTAGKQRATTVEHEANDEFASADDATTSRSTATAPSAKSGPTSKVRPRLRRPVSRRASVEAEEADASPARAVAPDPIASAAVEDEDEDSSEEEERVRRKKRVSKRRAPKKAAVDRFLFGGSDGEENEPAPQEADIPVRDDDDAVRDDVGEDGPPPKKKRSAPKKSVKKGKTSQKGKSAVADDDAEEGQAVAGSGEHAAGTEEAGDGASPRPESPEPLPPVEPDETTMAALADPQPKVLIGRPSQRTIFFEEREQRIKAERKQLLKLKRERMKRIKKGLPVTDDEDEGEGSGGRADAGASAAGSGVEGGADLQVDEDAIDPRFRLPSIPVDDDDADVEPENGGPFSGLDVINAALAVRENGHSSEGGGDGSGAEDQEDDAGFEETEWAPQMRIVDGQLVLDESSLQVERAGAAQQIINREVIEESAQDRFVNSSTYGKRKGGARWSKEETELFYDGISQFYTNFEMIALLFPHRSRHEIRRKFNREDKLNPKLVTAALARRKRVDIDAIAKITGADLSGPVPEDPMDAVNRRRAEIEANGGVPPEPHGGRKRKGKGKKEDGGDHDDDDDAAVLGAGRKRRGKKGAADAARGYMPGEERGEDAGEDGEEEDEDVRQIRLEMEEEERQRRIDEMEAAGAGA